MPLEGLAHSDSVNAFVVPEEIDNRDLNGDRSRWERGSVLMMQDRQTGRQLALDAPSGCAIMGTPDGRAVARIQSPPFSFPAMAVGGDVLAFLEAEPLAKACDENHDGDAIDTILRVFRLDATRQRARRSRRPRSPSMPRRS